MSKITRLLILLVVIAMLVGTFASCEVLDQYLNPDQGVEDSGDNKTDPTPGDDTGDSTGDNTGDSTGDNTGDNAGDNTEPEFVDYASQVKFNPNSGRVYAEVKVKSYIDGDTTHFITTDGTKIGDMGYVKARYLSINTPESTGVIEPWGKKASNYTKTQLMQATSIIIESDSDEWDLDSTGGRYLLWVWYKTAEDTEYRNLNLEILQQGLAFGSNVASNVYGETALAALNQAKAMKLHVFNKAVKDPDFYYGKFIVVSLEELKANTYWSEEDNRYVNKYEGKLVQFEAVVTKQVGPTIYVEEYDPETDMYFGMQLYAGYNYPRMTDFSIGNRVSIVGTLQYYENGMTFQVSNLQYDILDPKWDGGCRVIGNGFVASFKETEAKDIMSGTIKLDTYEEVLDDNGEVVDEVLVTKTFDYGEIAHYSSVSVLNLTVKSVYTTDSETDSDGALTITCVADDGTVIDVRTASQLTKLVDGVKVDVTDSDFPKGTVISVKGIIDSFKGEYQIKVFSIEDITFE